MQKPSTRFFVVERYHLGELGPEDGFTSQAEVNQALRDYSGVPDGVVVIKGRRLRPQLVLIDNEEGES